MTAALTIRSLQPADTAVLAAVLGRAYESQQNFALRLAVCAQLQYVATFVAVCDGLPVGMVVGHDYGRLAYVSQMGVEPALHRRGIGTALMDGLIQWADRRGFAAVELDATAAGAPLYARYGFVDGGETLVYVAGAAGGNRDGTRAYEAADRASIFATDARAFGADRREVLGLLIDAPQNSVVVAEADGGIAGYAVAQRSAELLGPVIAADAHVAARLFDAARADLPAGHRVSVPAHNAAGASLLVARGYQRHRVLRHMLRGVRPGAAREALFGRINLGQG